MSVFIFAAALFNYIGKFSELSYVIKNPPITIKNSLSEKIPPIYNEPIKEKRELISRR